MDHALKSFLRILVSKDLPKKCTFYLRCFIVPHRHHERAIFLARHLDSAAFVVY